MNFKDIKKLNVCDLVKDVETGNIFKVIEIDLSRQDYCPVRVELIKTFGHQHNTSTWEPANETLCEVGDQAWLYIDETSALLFGAEEMGDEDYIDFRTVITCEDLVLA